MLMRKLSHRNIVHYFGGEVDGEVLYIFCEWAAAGSVESMLKKFGPFAEQVCREFRARRLAIASSAWPQMLLRAGVCA